MPKRPIASDDDLDSVDQDDQLEQRYGIDEETEPGFERIRRNTGKTLNPKQDRRQQDKEWGKAINKHHKDRKRYGGPGKP